MFAIAVEIPQELKDQCWTELKTIASKPKRAHAFLEKDYYRLENKEKIWNRVKYCWY